MCLFSVTKWYITERHSYITSRCLSGDKPSLLWQINHQFQWRIYMSDFRLKTVKHEIRNFNCSRGFKSFSMMKCHLTLSAFLFSLTLRQGKYVNGIILVCMLTFIFCYSQCFLGCLNLLSFLPRIRSNLWKESNQWYEMPSGIDIYDYTQTQRNDIKMRFSRKHVVMCGATGIGKRIKQKQTNKKHIPPVIVLKHPSVANIDRNGSTGLKSYVGWLRVNLFTSMRFEWNFRLFKYFWRYFSDWCISYRFLTITWVNVDPDLCRHMTSFGRYEISIPNAWPDSIPAYVA